MKTALWISLLLLFCTLTPARAQFYLGIKGGISKAWEHYGDIGLPDDARIHIRGGNLSALAYYRVGRYLQIGIEPGFVRRGAACIPGFEVFDQDTKLLLNYVELPLMLTSRLPLLPGKVDLVGKAGYGMSYLTSAYLEVIDLNGIQPTTRNKMDLDAPDGLKRYDRGFYGSLGFAYLLGGSQLQLEGTYYRGQPNVDRFSVSENRGLSLALAYLVRL